VVTANSLVPKSSVASKNAALAAGASGRKHMTFKVHRDTRWEFDHFTELSAPSTL
jgi:hypothetical protein